MWLGIPQILIELRCKMLIHMSLLQVKVSRSLLRGIAHSSAVFGPDDTPWEGGVFSLRITFTENYPEKPPRVRFTSDMFHPNVYK